MILKETTGNFKKGMKIPYSYVWVTAGQGHGFSTYVAKHIMLIDVSSGVPRLMNRTQVGMRRG